MCQILFGFEWTAGLKKKRKPVKAKQSNQSCSVCKREGWMEGKQETEVQKQNHIPPPEATASKQDGKVPAARTSVSAATRQCFHYDSSTAHEAHW